MNVLVNEDSLKNIADAIRAKNNKTTLYKPGEMAAAIQTIEVGKKNFTVVPVDNETITVTPAGSGITISGNDYTLAFDGTIIATVSGNIGYTPGNITVGGVDQGSSSATLQVTEGMVISATEAVKKQNVEITFNVPALTLTDEGGGSYTYTGTDLKDEIGTYAMPTYKVTKATGSESLLVNITNPGLKSVNEVGISVVQGTQQRRNIFTLDASADIASQSFDIPAGDFDFTQALHLVIVLAGMAA